MKFYFYDLETTGLDPFKDRIMQFGGQSLDADLKPTAEIDQFYVQLSEDVLPTPEAIVTHKILPQQANLEGLSEYQFINWLEDNVYKKGTVYGGYNIAGFDNQFMRWLHWRNFAAPAPMLEPAASFDVYKMLRLAADLRPKGLNWPQKDDRSFSLTLSALTEANKLEHQASHTAGSDVLATVSLAGLLKKVQPKLFDHFLQLLQPAFVKEIINTPSALFLHSHYRNLAFGAGTTVAVILAEHPTKVGCFIVYDLRQPVDQWQKLSAYDLSLCLKKSTSPTQQLAPLSVLDVNQSPAVAPLSVLDRDSARRLRLDKTRIQANWKALKASDLATKAGQAYLKLSDQAPKPSSLERALARESFSESDQAKRQKVRQTPAAEIANLDLKFDDPRLKHLQFLYQARNFPKTLKTDQLLDWEKYKQNLFLNGRPSGLQLFKNQLRRTLSRLQARQDFKSLNLLEELQLYIESVLPEQTY